MSTLLIKRAYRVFLLSMASILIASMLAPIVAVASTDLVAGDTAIVNNPDGSGAYLRTDTTVLDDTTISAELPQGSTVWVQEAPVYNDTGVWVYVAADGYGPGWVSTALLEKVSTEEVVETETATEAAAAESAESETVTSELAWLEPIDSATVVDYNNVLPVEGLAVRAAIDGPVLGYSPTGTSLDVTSAREWVGEANYVRVNFNGVGGYVDGAFVELTSEVSGETPTEEVIWVETEVVTEVVPVETEVVTEVVPVETEVVTEVVPVETEVVTEVVPVETEVVTEVVPVETEVVTEVVPVETEVVTEVVPVETEVVTEVVTEEVAAETELVAEEAPATAEVTTDTEEASVATATLTETETPVVVATAAATKAPVEPTVAPAQVTTTTSTVAPTTVPAEPTAAPAKQAPTPAPTVVATKAPVEPTAVPTQVSTPAPIASTANTFDATKSIGSATVTGTTSGLLCRAEPNPASPVLMTLKEGTKVLVSAEAVNGYLGINCGGLQGFADVNYLWSGGAGDAEISAARMNVVVTGTGNGLNCRTGAGTSFGIITTVSDGTTLVTRGAASNGWTPVTCAGQNGFVSTTWIEAKAGSTTSTTSTATTGTATVNAGGDGLYCRSGAGTSYGVITVLSDGSTVAVRGAKQGDWVPVTCGGKAGFAHGSFLTVKAGSVTTAPTAPSTSTSTGSVTVANTGGQGLNCRSGAGTSFGVITTLALGQSVKTRSGSVSGWTAVICGGTNGFVSSQFVSGAAASAPAPTAPATPSGMVNGDHAKVTSSLNLRYSASLSSSVATVLDAGVVLLVTGSVTNSFYPVSYDGLKGFVHKDYVVETTAALSERGGSGTPTTTAPSVPTAPTTATGSALVNYAMRYVGYPYVWATHGPASFDCSGFTYWVVQNVMGKNIGYGTWTQVSAGTPVSKANLQPGDLVFFQNTYTAGLSHVGLYIGNGQFVHAQNEETGVVVSDINSSYYGPRWYGAVRL